VAVYPKTGNTPEAMIKILITIIDKTPSGGASLEDLKEAYSEAKGDFPTDRTIYRIIRRINELFDPLAYGGMKTKFSNAWGIWNLDDKDLSKLETVRLKAKKGVAERFNALTFHDSQKVRMLPGDEAEVAYTVSGAG